MDRANWFASDSLLQAVVMARQKMEGNPNHLLYTLHIKAVTTLTKLESHALCYNSIEIKYCDRCRMYACTLETI